MTSEHTGSQSIARDSHAACVDEADEESDHELQTDGGELLAELAGEGRVEIDPHPERGRTGIVGSYDGRGIRVSGPPISSFNEGRDFTRTWRVATDDGAFDVAYSIDRTPGNRTHTVIVTEVSDE
jgi:hypothetical protein